MKILFVSLGCDKNLVDTEVMLGMLDTAGYSFTDDEDEADIAVVNTCCFINDAKQESIDTLLHLARKKKNKLKVLIAAGCLAQRYQNEIQTEIPEVDAIIGTTAIDSITDAIQSAVEGKGRNDFEDLNRAVLANRKRAITTGGHYAYLKIAEGCNKRCTYCIIPQIRGSYRSVPMEELESEARTLVEGGVKELILVAQETTLYGEDLYGAKKLPQLLTRLCRIEELQWIRILYCYPEEITEELIDVIAKEEKICNYLDIPIQNSSDEVLRRMGRRTTRQDITQRITMLREKIPDICLRTTLITGFPGETISDHKDNLDFVKNIRFDRLGVFTYSPEEGTPASLMRRQIPEFVKKRRQKRIMKLQQKIAFKEAEAMKGKVLKAMVEGYMPQDNVCVARTYKDAPGVDGMVFVATDRELISGTFINVEITESNQYDLIGEIKDELTK